MKNENLIDDYICKSITHQLNERNIQANKRLIDSMILDVNSGIYSFRLIWSDPMDLIKYYKLDHTLVKTRVNSELISIDGGVRYQWSNREIIQVDLTVIRDLKIKTILEV
jgi:hypothetical protein